LGVESICLGKVKGYLLLVRVEVVVLVVGVLVVQILLLLPYLAGLGVYLGYREEVNLVLFGSVTKVLHIVYALAIKL